MIMRSHRWAIVLSRVVAAGMAVVVVLVPAGCGDDPLPTRIAAADGQTVRVVMTDNHFALDELSVAAGATINFEFENTGAVGHRAFIGTEAEQDAYSAGTLKATAENEVQIDRRGIGTLAYRFASPGTFVVGCHQPAHYAAGMRFVVKVQ